jgi:hypothetical protein
MKWRFTKVTPSEEAPFMALTFLSLGIHSQADEKVIGALPV